MLLFFTVILSINAYSMTQKDLIFSKLYDNQEIFINNNNNFNELKNDFIRYRSYSAKLLDLIQKYNNNEYYISNNNFVFYKTVDDIWKLQYNVDVLINNGFEEKKSTKKIVQIPFSYNPRILSEYNHLDTFVLNLKDKIKDCKEIMFLMNETLSAKTVASIVNLGRFFMDTGLFYHKEVLYGSIQGNNSDLMSIDDLKNDSLMFYYIEDLDSNLNLDDDISDKGIKLSYNDYIFFDSQSNNLIYMRDSPYLLKIVDYISLKLIGVNI